MWKLFIDIAGLDMSYEEIKELRTESWNDEEYNHPYIDRSKKMKVNIVFVMKTSKHSLNVYRNKSFVKTKYQPPVGSLLRSDVNL